MSYRISRLRQTLTYRLPRSSVAVVLVDKLGGVISMKQICSQKSSKVVNFDRKAIQTKLSRVTFIAGLALMGLSFCLEDAPFEWIAVTGITGSLLALGSMWWTGWGDW